VFVGGELTLDQLDLRYDTFTKMYQAPFQLKASGGVLIIDDFGRQLVAPRDLLSRWIVPLEKRVDFLTLHTGVKFPVPFDALIVFATNLNPHDLVDEAFLRRIRYKLNVVDPDREQYEEIFQRECAKREIRYTAAAVEYIYRRYYGGKGIPPRSCHPRDILDHVLHAAWYEERDPVLTPELLDHACRTYFLIMAHEHMEASAA
jgi:predicted ATPase with chaperone activity